VIASTASNFFSSGTWLVIRNLLIFFAVVFWLATVWWIYKDAKRRIEDPWLVGMSVMLGVAVPFFGPFIYMLFRPPEYLDDVRERELEIKAMEDRLSKRDLHCPVCRSEVDSTYLVCPSRSRRCGNSVRTARRRWSRLRPHCRSSSPVVAAARSSYSPRRWPWRRHSS
jgi:hypothetical protein